MVNKPKYFYKQAGIAVSLFCFIIISACSGNETIVASVDESELTKTDAEILMHHLGYNINKQEDWQTFINQWTEQELLRKELIETNPQKSQLVEMRSKAFAGELSRSYLEEALIMKELDTVISENELQAYFEKHQDEFALQDYLVQALYIKLRKNTKVEEDIKKHYLLKNDKDLSKVNSYAKLYAENFYFNDEQWIYFNELTKDIPLNRFNKDNIVLNRTKTYFEDEEYIYFLNIIDYKLKDATPPFEFLKPQIREILLSQKINKLREQLVPKLIQNTKKKHDIKINI